MFYTNFDRSFEKLSYLLHLDLTANQISQLPLTIINLPYLSELLLSDNAIWDLPEDIGRLRYSLKRLNVAGNKIEKLPDSIGTLVLCEEMDFSRNQIFELPVTMKGCIRLSRLNVSQNIIEYCDVLSDLKMLEYVDISSNRIGNFPDMIQGIRVHGDEQAYTLYSYFRGIDESQFIAQSTHIFTPFSWKHDSSEEAQFVTQPT